MIRLPRAAKNNYQFSYRPQNCRTPEAWNMTLRHSANCRSLCQFSTCFFQFHTNLCQSDRDLCQFDRELYNAAISAMQATETLDNANIASLAEKNNLSILQDCCTATAGQTTACHKFWAGTKITQLMTTITSSETSSAFENLHLKDADY